MTTTLATTLVATLRATALALGASLACAAASAGPVLQVNLVAPNELQLGQADIYTLTVRNTGNAAVDGVMTRFALAPGMAVMQMPANCLLHQPTQTVHCGTEYLLPAKFRSYQLVLRAPAQSATVIHRAEASGNGAATAVSANTVTQYAHYDVAVTAGSGVQWQMRSCGTAQPNDLCPPSSEAVTNFTINAIGQMVIGTTTRPQYRWQQPNPHEAVFDQYDSAGTYVYVVNYAAINSRCLRGHGTSVQPSATPKTNSSKICRL